MCLFAFRKTSHDIYRPYTFRESEADIFDMRVLNRIIICIDKVGYLT